jgi:4-hydroxy-tetrahydrodipicolinate reductase
LNQRRYRVVQWATGNIGTRALREVIRHPGLELAGVVVYDPAKAGVDAGVLCGEAPVGIVATDDRSAARELEADCVLYMPRLFDLDDVEALLASGKNVVTTRGEVFGGGHRLGAEARARLLDACTRGNSSIYATGSSPGFITETLPYALLSLQRHVESIEIDEFANMSRRDSPHMIFRQMGFGQPLDSYDPKRAAYLLGEFQPSLALLAAAANLDIDEWSAAGEVAAARQATTIVAGELPAGTVAAQRTTVVGRRAGLDVVRFSANWYCTADVEPAWDLRPTGWRVRVRGDAPMDVEIGFPVPLDELGAMTPALTANRPVNAVPYVCAAPPGILSTTDLPVITPAGPPESDPLRLRA